jgi:hypothetical protein
MLSRSGSLTSFSIRDIEMGQRFKMRDGRAPGRRVARIRDAAEKNEVASFRGEQYVSEIVGDKLIISTKVYSETKGIQDTWVATYESLGGFRYSAERSGETLTVYSEKNEEATAAATLQPGVRTGDARVKDALRSIRDNIATAAAVNKSAGDFWSQQRAAQDAIFK